MATCSTGSGATIAMVYYQAMDNPAFQQGTKFTQLVAASDLIVRV
jgi:hypothetical protein